MVVPARICGEVIKYESESYLLELFIAYYLPPPSPISSPHPPEKRAKGGGGGGGAKVMPQEQLSLSRMPRGLLTASFNVG
jgi:hypothetical protein